VIESTVLNVKEGDKQKPYVLKAEERGRIRGEEETGK
jgi:hypothetical protein